MEDSCSREFLASIENVNIEHLRPNKSGADPTGYGWYKSQQETGAQRRVMESRRDELLQLLYGEGLTTEQVEGLVREWIVLVVERDRLFREQLNKENNQNKAEYLRHLKQMLQSRPPFGDGSEEVNIQESLLKLEAHITQYCSTHSTASPSHQPEIKQLPLRDMSAQSNTVMVQVATTPKPAQLYTLDMETGQTRIPNITQPSTANTPSLVDETDGLVNLPGLSATTPPHPPVPAKPQNLQDKFSSPQGKSTNKRTYKKPVDNVPTHPSRDNCKMPGGVVHGTNISLSISDRVMSHDSLDTIEHPHLPTTATDPPPTHPPPPPPLPPLHPCLPPARSSGRAMGTVQFSGSRQEGGNTHSELQDQSFIEPSTEDRKCLLEEISSMGQASLRRTQRARTPGGTPMKITRNRLTLTGNTDMFQRALISKFRTFHSTPIKQLPPGNTEQSDSIETSNTWSDINASVVFEDPDLTTTPTTDLNVSSDRSGCLRVLECDPNTSTAV